MTKQAEAVNMGGAIANFYKNYAVFSGRSSRSEYWYVWLFSLLAGVGLGIFFFIPSVEIQATAYLLALLIGLASLLPGIALTVRRLRDAGFSPYWTLLVLVPFGGIVLLILAIEQSTKAPRASGGHTGGVGTNVSRSNPTELELQRLDDLHKKGLIDSEQLRLAKNKALGI